MSDTSSPEAFAAGPPGDALERIVLWRAIEQSSASVVITDRDGVIQYVNPVFVELTGYRREEAIGRNPRILRSDVTPRETYVQLWEVLTAGGVWRGRFVNRKKDGSLYHESAVISPVLDAAGTITHFVAVKEDITERLRLEEALAGRVEAAYRELDLIFQTATGGMRVVNRDFVVTRANQTLARMAGTPREAMIGRKCWETFPDSRCSRDDCTIQRALRGESIRGLEIEKRAADGRVFTCALDVREIWDADGRLVGVVQDFRDLTETRRLQAVAEAVNTASNIGFAFSGIRHELGNPVNAVKTTLTVLRRRLDVFSGEEVAGYLDRALHDVSRMEYLLRFLKSYNMFETPAPEPVQLEPFFTRLHALVEGDVGRRGVELEYRCESPGLVVWADPRALQQVFLNLVSNAVDALQGRPEPRIRVTASAAGQYGHVEIADNGAGIPAAARANLFKPFFTTRPGGTGLGLVIVKKMLAKMNATIELTSEEGAGTRVLLSLPKERRR